MPSLFANYTPSDIKTLGEFSNFLVTTFEYWDKYRQDSVIKTKYLDEILKYYNSLYLSQICLILKIFDNKYYKYTRNRIIKAIRGFNFHGDHKNLKNLRIRL